MMKTMMKLAYISVTVSSVHAHNRVKYVFMFEIVCIYLSIKHVSLMKSEIPRANYEQYFL